MANELKELINNAYVPISNFKVASIVETKMVDILKGLMWKMLHCEQGHVLRTMPLWYYWRSYL